MHRLPSGAARQIVPVFGRPSDPFVCIDHNAAKLPGLTDAREPATDLRHPGPALWLCRSRWSPSGWSSPTSLRASSIWPLAPRLPVGTVVVCRGRAGPLAEVAGVRPGRGRVAGPLLGIVLDRLLFRSCERIGRGQARSRPSGCSIGIPSIVDFVAGPSRSFGHRASHRTPIASSPGSVPHRREPGLHRRRVRRPGHRDRVAFGTHGRARDASGGGEPRFLQLAGATPRG